MPQPPGFPVAAEYLPDERQHRRIIARTANLALAGKLNAVGNLTLTAGATSTAIADSRIGPGSLILWCPLTASASTAEKAGMWISSRGDGTCTIQHAASAAVDQTFAVGIIG